MQINVFHTISGLQPERGGPVRTVPKLCQALAEFTPVNVRLLSQKKKGESIIKIDTTNLDLWIKESDSRLQLKMGWPLARLLHGQIQNQIPDVLHDHGIWLPANHFVVAAARRYGIPLMVHLRGMLEPWAMEYRGRRKQMALCLYQRRDLQAVSVFCATSAQEVQSVRRLGFRQPIAVIPNGISLPQAAYSRKFADKNGIRNLVFLSRIHPVKGLLILVEAWSRLRPSGWRLRLAGPDEGGHVDQVMHRVKQSGLHDTVEYVGQVEGDSKARLLASADLFVLPSYSENFGVVVAEALSYGVPVITTRGTPWQGLVERRCGWWIEMTVEVLTETLREALALDNATLREMGERGRGYVREFDWQSIAEQTAEVYRWVLGRGDRPSSVVTE